MRRISQPAEQVVCGCATRSADRLVPGPRLNFVYSRAKTASNAELFSQRCSLGVSSAEAACVPTPADASRFLKVLLVDLAVRLVERNREMSPQADDAYRTGSCDPESGRGRRVDVYHRKRRSWTRCRSHNRDPSLAFQKRPRSTSGPHQPIGCERSGEATLSTASEKQNLQSSGNPGPSGGTH